VELDTLSVIAAFLAIIVAVAGLFLNRVTAMETARRQEVGVTQWMRDHYGDRHEEFYDLSEDPLERRNLADERDPAELRKHRYDLLEWRARVEVMYSPTSSRTH
jgi:hypothetical protein